MKAFVCYPSEHLEHAREVATFLTAVGLDTWFDKENLVVGEDWDRARKAALGAADVVVALCASQTTARDGVYQRELGEALEHLRDRRLGSVYLMPIRVEDVALPPELSRLQYVDKWDPSWRRRLAAGLIRAAGEHGEDPAPPLRVAAARSDEGGVVDRSARDRSGRGEIDVTWISYSATGDYWDYVNGVIAARALGEFYSARREIARREMPGGSSVEFGVSEFFRKGELVSLVMGGSSYYAGAAHPNNFVFTTNLLGPGLGLVTIRELFEDSDEARRFLLRYVQLDLERQFLGMGEDAPDLSDWFARQDWELLEQFTFNDAGLVLNLSAASGMPHAFGVLDVYLPWEQSARFLGEPFKAVLLDRGGG